MSTAARKARKRENNILRSTAGLGPIQYQHPVKTPTPIHERAANSPRQYQLPNGDIKYGISSRGRRRLADHIKITLESAVQADDGEAVKLDPKPYRVGRKRYTNEEVVLDPALDEAAEFSPRKGYSLDALAYPGL